MFLGVDGCISSVVRSKPTGLSNGTGFVGIDIEGACIHDVVMEESDPVAAVSAALSRISEFPEGVPFARPRICIVMYLQQILCLLNYSRMCGRALTQGIGMWRNRRCQQSTKQRLCSTVAQPSYNLRLRWPVTNNPYVIWCYVLEPLLIMPVQSRIRASARCIATQQHAHLQRDCFQPRHSYFKSFIEASMLLVRIAYAILCRLWIRSALESSMADIIAGSENEWKERRLVQTTPYCATAVKC
ncbi:hypothetical protein KCU93_g316, partial [Aureobasidium melanogenum]